MKPDNIDRAELLDGVMANYRRFYMKKMLFQYPWVKDPVRRRYLIGCIKAFFLAAIHRRFYDLGKHRYWGPALKRLIRFDYDKSKSKIVEPDHNAWKKAPAAKRKQTKTVTSAIKACGGGGDHVCEGSAGRAVPEMPSVELAPPPQVAQERPAKQTQDA
jgi:anaerobic magnesium-protoporphyrin IX monomethyl ester cyclase